VLGAEAVLALFVAVRTCRSCTFNLVRITSSGVVKNPAIAPDKKPLNTNVPKLNSPDGLITFRKLSLVAIEQAAKGMFIANVVGKLRNKAIGPSILRIDLNASKTLE
jgi:hypothetical protein